MADVSVAALQRGVNEFVGLPAKQGVSHVA